MSLQGSVHWHETVVDDFNIYVLSNAATNVAQMGPKVGCMSN